MGKIIGEEDDGDFEVSYLRKSSKRAGFVTPIIPDIHSVKKSDIQVVLPKPTVPKFSTKRNQASYVFDFNFDSFRLG